MNLDKLDFKYITEKLATFTTSFEGKKLALNLEPSTNSLQVQSMLNETTEAVNLSHEKGSFPISEISDVSIYLKTLAGSLPLTSKGLIELAKVLRCARELNNYFYANDVAKEDLPNTTFAALEPYFSYLYSNKDVEEKINKSILAEDLISDNASLKLSSIRKSKKSLEIDIKNRLNTLIHSSSYSKYIMDAVITIRDNRFVIPVKEEYRSFVKGFIHDTSASGSTVYIEPLSIFEINNKINNLAIEETKEIERILAMLTNLLKPISTYLKRDLDLISKLDFINAKAKLAIDMDASLPILADEVNLRFAKHPLIEKTKAIPNNIYVGKDFTTLVITGPNTGGKTVTLKTVGIICAMAQSGLYIPALDGSKVKVFDNIFVDIGDSQSIEESLSTFSSHMINIIEITKKVTSKSLVLVDELGSGTDPAQGATLAIALLEYFHNKGAFTIATTHYQEIKNYCITHDSYENASCEFDIENLTPTYKLLIGIPGKSYAFSISKRLGLDTKILDRASSLIEKPATDIETLMKEIYDDRIAIEKIKEEHSKNLNQVELLRKSLEKEASSKLEKEEQKLEKVKNEARTILLNAKEEANEIINELTKLEKGNLKKANELRNSLNSKIKETSPNSGLDLSVLLKLNNQETIKPNKKSTTHVQNSKSMNTSSEINLIGETAFNAVQELDKYLDNCTMAHLHQVRVVHGKGTGKLREEIHKYLKKSKYVSSYRIAGFGEGDYGVTIVELK